VALADAAPRAAGARPLEAPAGRPLLRRPPDGDVGKSRRDGTGLVVDLDEPALLLPRQGDGEPARGVAPRGDPPGSVLASEPDQRPERLPARARLSPDLRGATDDADQRPA